MRQRKGKERNSRERNYLNEMRGKKCQKEDPQNSRAVISRGIPGTT